MRHIIMREGDDARHGGRIVEVGALTFPDKLPVVWMNDYQNHENRVGMATDVRRCRDGYVTAEIEITTTKVKWEDVADLICYSIYATHLDVAPGHRVVGGTVRAVTTLLRYTGANLNFDGTRALMVPWADMKASDVE